MYIMACNFSSNQRRAKIEMHYFPGEEESRAPYEGKGLFTTCGVYFQLFVE